MPGSWCAVAPVRQSFHLAPGILDEPFDLGHGLTLERKPTWFGDEAIPTYLGHFDREHVSAAGLALVVTRKSDSRPPGQEEQENDRSKIREAQLAIWVASGIRCRYDLVVSVEPPGRDGKRRCSGWTSLPLDVARFPSDATLTGDHLRDARELIDVFLGLEREGSLRVAFRMAALASDQYHGDVAFTLIWVGLEALFGPQDPGETVYQVALRIALFLETDPEKRLELFGRVKKSYGRRSSVVHGRADGLLKKRTEEVEEAELAFHETVGWLRGALRRIALNEELRLVFSGKDRDSYLAELPFGRTPSRGD